MRILPYFTQNLEISYKYLLSVLNVQFHNKTQKILEIYKVAVLNPWAHEQTL